MQNKWHEHSVGNIVVNFPLSSAIFRAAGIDYCCGGGRLLGEVIKEQRLVDSNIYKALDELAARTEKPAEPFSEMSAERLVEFILTKHHSYLWGALPEAHELIVKVLKAHGKRHPELYDVYKLFGQLSHEMEPHLIREETELFPAIANSEAKEHCQALVHILEEEHEPRGLCSKSSAMPQTTTASPATGAAPSVSCTRNLLKSRKIPCSTTILKTISFSRRSLRSPL